MERPLNFLSTLHYILSEMQVGALVTSLILFPFFFLDSAVRVFGICINFRKNLDVPSHQTELANLSSLFVPMMTF